MAQKIHRRDYTQAIIWTDSAPETDPIKDVKTAELRIEVQGTIVRVDGRDAAGQWQLINSWDALIDRPTTFPPEAHHLNPGIGPHEGLLDLRFVRGHTVRAHRRTLMLAGLLARRGRLVI